MIPEITKSPKTKGRISLIPYDFKMKMSKKDYNLQAREG